MSIIDLITPKQFVLPAGLYTACIVKTVSGTTKKGNAYASITFEVSGAPTRSGTARIAEYFGDKTCQTVEGEDFLPSVISFEALAGALNARKQWDEVRKDFISTVTAAGRDVSVADFLILGATFFDRFAGQDLFLSREENKKDGKTYTNTRYGKPASRTHSVDKTEYHGDQA